MALHVQLNLTANEDGEFSAAEYRVLAALNPTRSGHTDAPSEGFPTVKQAEAEVHRVTVESAENQQKANQDLADAHVVSPSEDQQKLLDDVEPTETEKPKRKRRTKAEIEADRLAEEEAAKYTGPAVLQDDKTDPLEDLGDVAALDKAQYEMEQAGQDTPLEDPTADEDLLGTDEPAEPAKTGADAIAKATELYHAGETAKLKAALESLGLDRARELTDENAAQFFELVK